MLNYDKTSIRESLNIDNIYELLIEFGADPEYTVFGILSTTICHNAPGEGSRKLYYYTNSGLFHCYTGCDSFDIFELVQKVADIQWHQKLDLNDAIRWIARRFGIAKILEEDFITNSEDWKILSNYDRIQEIKNEEISEIVLKEYDKKILKNLNYTFKLTPWLKEGISQEAMRQAQIGYYLTTDQITIPHFDINGRFIGLRGRTMCKEDAEFYGKYRPIKVNQQLYNHPLGMNLYNLNFAKPQIQKIKKAIIFESEKQSLLFKSYFGLENDISVACCGFNVSSYQMYLLQQLGAQEVIVALDRQFQKIGDDEYKHLLKNLTNLYHKYKNSVSISFILDKHKYTDYKDSPIDKNPDIFMKLYEERVNTL